MTEREICQAARERANSEDQGTFLDEACGGDEALRERVEALLRTEGGAAGTLDVPEAAPTVSDDAETRAFAGAPTQGDDGQARTDDEGREGHEAGDVLALLAPPGRPGSLGRIGRYEVLEVLGAGGFGVVFRAVDATLERSVAVKVMAPAVASSATARRRFLREARSSAAVRHENVVQIYAVEEAPLPHLVMEYIPGETLQQQLDRRGPLGVPEALRVGRQVAEGLAAAHANGLIHRDIKPSNILLEDDARRRVKITDFGLARAVDDASLTRSGVIAGTPQYMAPEQARGEPLDHRADLFSLGSVLYVMVTGTPPFRAQSTIAVLKRVSEDAARPIREVTAEVPERLCRVVETLHAKAPGDRPQSAREVADLLADCERQWEEFGTLPEDAPIPEAKPLRRWRGRWAIATALLIAASLLVAAGLGTFALTGQGKAKRAEAIRETASKPPTAVPRSPAPPAGDGFVPLFNGEDLTGWVTHPSQDGEWKVEGGAIAGRGPRGYLFTERDDFKNFHLRLEARIGAGGNGGVYVRCGYGADLMIGPYPVPHGYEVEIAAPDGSGKAAPCGTLFRLNEFFRIAYTDVPSPPADSWMTLEVIADGSRLVTLVNGQKTLVYDDPQQAFDRGRIALQANTPGVTMEVRKVEIRAFPDSPPPPAPAEPAREAGGTSPRTPDNRP